jgi:hypothetical protein
MRKEAPGATGASSATSPAPRRTDQESRGLRLSRYSTVTPGAPAPSTRSAARTAAAGASPSRCATLAAWPTEPGAPAHLPCPASRRTTAAPPVPTARSRSAADTPPTAASAAGESAAHTTVTAAIARVPFFFSPAPILSSSRRSSAPCLHSPIWRWKAVRTMRPTGVPGWGKPEPHGAARRTRPPVKEPRVEFWSLRDRESTRAKGRPQWSGTSVFSFRCRATESRRVHRPAGGNRSRTTSTHG